MASRQLGVAVTESKSGRQAWQAKVFVDTSGDGDLAALAGCGFDYGRDGSGETQPMTLMALLTGIRIDAVGAFVTGRVGVGEAAKDNLLRELQRAGVAPSYGHPTLFHVRDELFALMANHQYAVFALDAAQMPRLGRAQSCTRQYKDYVRSATLGTICVWSRQPSRLGCAKAAVFMGSTVSRRMTSCGVPRMKMACAASLSRWTPTRPTRASAALGEAAGVLAAHAALAGVPLKQVGYQH